MGVAGAFLNLNEIGKPVRFISVGARYLKEIVGESGKVIWNIPQEGGYLPYYEGLAGQLISLAAFVGLCLFCYFFARGRKKLKDF